MKTKVLLSALSIFFLASCSSEDIVSTLSEESHAETQNYDVSIDIPSFKYDEVTRTSFTESSTGIDINWSANDKVGIFPESGFQNCFTVSGGSGSSSASFDGGNWALKKNKNYYAYYPFSKANFDNSIESVPLTYEGQCIPRINKTDNLAEFDYMFAEGTQPEEEKLNFSFSHKGCVLKVVLNMPEVAKYTKLTVSTDGEFPIASNYNILTDTRTTTSTTTSFDISLDNMNIIKAGKATFYLMLPPCDLSSNTLTFTLYSESNSYVTHFGAKHHKESGAYAYTTSEPMDVDAVQQEYYTINGVQYPMPEAVDLGLPSGTKWANMNIGACMAEDYGLYFAWGETTGYTSGTSDGHSFDWASYKWCNGSETTITKYCTDSRFGTVDNKTELELSDDAATVNCGGDWQMPSEEQLIELLSSDYTSIEWTTVNGFCGEEIISKINGNSIFLPAAGCRVFSDLSFAGYNGLYWTRSLYSNFLRNAIFVEFYSSGNINGSDNRCHGNSIRPVCVQK